MRPSEWTDIAALWPAGQDEMRRLTQELIETTAALEGVSWEVVFREGVSYSFRAKTEGDGRELMVMIDVIPPADDEWWLSVCFFKEDITDPQEMGDLVPGGLMGQDGYCFDLEEADRGRLDYLLERVREAHQAGRG